MRRPLNWQWHAVNHSVHLACDLSTRICEIWEVIYTRQNSALLQQMPGKKTKHSIWSRIYTDQWHYKGEGERKFSACKWIQVHKTKSIESASNWSSTCLHFKKKGEQKLNDDSLWLPICYNFMTTLEFASELYDIHEWLHMSMIITRRSLTHSSGWQP